jgi:hypothetical protein
MKLLMVPVYISEQGGTMGILPSFLEEENRTHNT